MLTLVRIFGESGYLHKTAHGLSGVTDVNWPIADPHDHILSGKVLSGFMH